MSKKNNGFLGYYRLDGAIVHEQDSLEIGRFFREGGCRYEFSVVWEVLGQHNVPCLRVFNDAWQGLYSEHQPLLKTLAENDGKDLQIDELIKILKSLGYKECK